ncbi:helix-turn-helix transcriptional regulator [Plantactinospora sp. CA-294935]|uniref:helix-turn-helix transcriptional regulator n=1 Tax=Plantactinospora sp. CA-294935 TaxID=3240012 RepID=UPI003D9332D7
MALRRRRLASRRKSTGHTQESLAEKLNVDRTTVVRWERAESEPQPWVRPGLANALQVTLEELTQLLDDVEEANTRQGDRLAYVLKNPRTADLATVAYLRHELDALTETYDTTPSTSLLPTVGRLHGEIALLHSSASIGGVRQALATLHAASATLMGQLVWDASQRRDRRTAIRYYEQAVAVARQSNEILHEAHARLRTGFVALYADRDPKRGLSQAAHAAHLAADFGSGALAGLAMLHVAEAYAMVGERSACHHALGQAGDRIDSVDTTDPAHRLVTAGQFDRVVGSCYLALGDPRKAQPVLEATSSVLRTREKSRSIVLGNLALAHIRQRHVAEATAVLHEAIDVVERTRAGGGLNVLFRASRELHRWRNRHEVYQVTDRILSLIAR